MRKVQLLLLCLLVSVAAFAAEKVIKLPKPNMNRSGSVMNALSERHSTREYAAKALTSADLSDLLWAANGVNRPADGKRTAPSAMNKQDVDVYVVLPQGTYLYDAKAHQLNAGVVTKPVQPVFIVDKPFGLIVGGMCVICLLPLTALGLAIALTAHEFESHRHQPLSFCPIGHFFTS